MKMPANIGSHLWSAAAGAVALAIVGFSWGGWVTGGTAARDVATATQNATVLALAPICAERFRSQADAPAKTAELMKSSAWERGAVIEKAGFATMTGGGLANSDVATACASLLATAPALKN